MESGFLNLRLKAFPTLNLYNFTFYIGSLTSMQFSLFDGVKYGSIFFPK